MMSALFNILLFLIPLIFFKNSSEIFEFNKIITLYIFTILIIAAWAVKSVKQQKFIFRRTILDRPLVAYLVAMSLSTFFSIDPRTSWLGYYSRFNGGVLSQICYTLLYWAFVSNLTKKQAIHATYYILLSTTIASVLAISEHFGIGITCGLMGLGWDTSCWIQDVQNRVFSTFGQPNWLAATLVALIPLTWLQNINSKKVNAKSIFWFLISILFFVTLLFTKSRSALLAFGVETIIFWSFIFYKEKKRYLKQFLIINILFLALFFGFSFRPKTNDLSPVTLQNPSLEVGGTESGAIRKNVWKGAIRVWQKYPLTGSGVETFAFAFPSSKPLEHNLVSEWDFIYNKAHNEYLNYLATTGMLGLISYLLLIIFSLFQIKNFKNRDLKLNIAIGAGYCSILITNFFGFSVVPISLLFFLLPALTVASSKQHVDGEKTNKLNLTQKFGVFAVILATSFMLHATFRYFVADIYYNKARIYNRSNDIIGANESISKAIKLNPRETIFYSESSVNKAEIAILLAKDNKIKEAEKIKDESINESERAIAIAPYNLNVKKTYVGVLTKLSQFDKNYLLQAVVVLQSAIQISPNDPKLYYQLGLMFLKTGQNNNGLKTLEKSVELKPNYKEGRFALGAVYKDLEMFDKAKEQFEYILDKIDPNDETTKKYLKEIN